MNSIEIGPPLDLIFLDGAPYFKLFMSLGPLLELLLMMLVTPTLIAHLT
jgi:hypothetical protein